MEQLEIMPVRVRIAAVLRKEILAGEFQGGQELSLTEVAEKLGVSRTPVREAFQSLAAEGLIELRMNKGAVVCPVDEKFICDHYDMRIVLEGEAAARAAQRRMDPGALLELQARAEAGFEAMTQEEYRVYNQTIHTRIWQAADNQKLFQYLMGLWNGPSTGKAVTDAEHRALSIREHRYILQRIAQGDSQAGREAMEQHIRRSKENILRSFQLK